MAVGGLLRPASPPHLVLARPGRGQDLARHLARNRSHATETAAHQSTKRNREDSRSPIHERQPKQAKGGAPSLVSRLREGEREWQDRCVRAEKKLEDLQRRFDKLQKTSSDDRTAYENERVQINADLQEEKATSEHWKADCLAVRSEFTAMRKERDSLKRQVDALSDTQHKWSD
jgi:SMC interacting uncharacterized protein involved in chromosome segregation